MGREITADCRYAGQSGPTRLLLEAEVLILRGAIRARIARSGLTDFRAEGDDLILSTTEGPLCARLGAREAALWVRALAKPRPGLAQKLGVSPQTPAWVIGPLTDAALRAAVQDCQSPTSGLVIAELPDAAAFQTALAQFAALPSGQFWGVTRKGKAAGFSDADLRLAMRAAGFIDSKSCAVSASMTATRYSRARS